jgi:lipoyl synthase
MTSVLQPKQASEYTEHAAELAETPLRKPEWLKVALPKGERYQFIKSQRVDKRLATVCEEARCPNIGECWSGGTATFMLMGDTCTRGCKFCAIKTGNPKGMLDADEPQKITDTVRQMNLDYVVLTSVDRDDLPDGGADHFAKTVECLKAAMPELLVETLIPDFKGNHDDIRRMLASNPDVVAQNIETVRRLTHPVRDPRAGYQSTLDVLQFIKQVRPDIITKSSIMLGLGETDDEVLECMADLRAHGVEILTLGQYLQPTAKQLPVKRFVSPEAFDQWEETARKLGFLYCAAGPLVRSSYRAGEYFIQEVLKSRRKQA